MGGAQFLQGKMSQLGQMGSDLRREGAPLPPTAGLRVPGRLSFLLSRHGPQCLQTIEDGVLSGTESHSKANSSFSGSSGLGGYESWVLLSPAHRTRHTQGRGTQAWIAGSLKPLRFQRFV